MIEDIRKIIAFQQQRNWKQFHSPKNLAISLALESAEILELFQWSKDNYLSHVSQNDPKFKILSRLVTNLEYKISQMQPAQIPQNTVDFQIHFDKRISEHSTSLGWTPLSEIRAKVCASLDITPEKFYSLVSSLIEQYQSKYEISTGGQEGIHVRGMLHGYIRKLSPTHMD